MTAWFASGRYAACGSTVAVVGPPSTSDAAIVTVEAPNADPVDTAIAHDDREAIRVALASLPAAQRQAIELAYFGGFSQAEIAASHGEPLGTIKTRMRLALQKMRDLLATRRPPKTDLP